MCISRGRMSSCIVMFRSDIIPLPECSSSPSIPWSSHFRCLAPQWFFSFAYAAWSVSQHNWPDVDGIHPWPATYQFSQSCHVVGQMVFLSSVKLSLHFATRCYFAEVTCLGYHTLPNCVNICFHNFHDNPFQHHRRLLLRGFVVLQWLMKPVLNTKWSFSPARSTTIPACFCGWDQFCLTISFNHRDFAQLGLISP